MHVKALAQRTAEASQRAAAPRTIVLDRLETLDVRHRAALGELIPLHLPETTLWICAARTGSWVAEELLARHNVRHLDLDAAPAGGPVIEAIWNRAHPPLPQEQLAAAIAGSESNVLYATGLYEQYMAGDPAPWRHNDLPPPVRAYYAAVWAEFMRERDLKQAEALVLFKLLCTSRDPGPEILIAAMKLGSRGLSDRARTLLRRGGPTNAATISIFDPTFQRYLSEFEFRAELPEIHARWATHLGEVLSDPAVIADVQRYATRHILHHQAMSARWHELIRTLGSQRYLETATRHGAVALERDLESACARAPDDIAALLLAALAAIRAQTHWLADEPLAAVGATLDSLTHDPRHARVWGDAIVRDPGSLRLLHPVQRPDGSARTRTRHRSAVKRCWPSDHGPIWSLDGEGTLIALDAETWAPIARFDRLASGGPICEHSGNGKLLAVSIGDASVQLFVLDPEPSLQDIVVSEPLTACCFSPDGARLATASAFGTIQLWSTADGRELASMTGTGSPRALVFVDADQLLSADSDGSLRLWHVPTGRCTWSIPTAIVGIHRLAVDDDGKYALCAAGDAILRRFRLGHSGPAAELRGHTGAIRHCAFKPGGRIAASVADDRSVIVWEVTTQRLLRRLYGHWDRILHCAWSADGHSLLTASSDRTIKQWAWADLKAQERPGHEQEVLGCAASGDGVHIFSASADATVRIWSADTGRELATLVGHTRRVHDCRAEPDGNWLVSASDDGNVRIWNARTHVAHAVLRSEGAPLRKCQLSGDGKYVTAVCADGRVTTWERASGLVLRVTAAAAGKFGCAAFLSRRSAVLTGYGDGGLRLHDWSTDRTLGAWSGHSRPVTAVAVSQDDGRAISGADNGELVVWDLATRRATARLPGHAATIRGCAWSPGGTYFATVAADHTLRVWHGADGRCVATAGGHAPFVCVTFAVGLLVVGDVLGNVWMFEFDGAMT